MQLIRKTVPITQEKYDAIRAQDYAETKAMIRLIDAELRKPGTDIRALLVRRAELRLIARAFEDSEKGEEK